MNYERITINIASSLPAFSWISVAEEIMNATTRIIVISCNMRRPGFVTHENQAQNIVLLCVDAKKIHGKDQFIDIGGLSTFNYQPSNIICVAFCDFFFYGARVWRQSLVPLFSVDQLRSQFEETNAPFVSRLSRQFSAFYHALSWYLEKTLHGLPTWNSILGSAARNHWSSDQINIQVRNRC